MPHVGTHGIRHRATTDIANSGVPIEVGMTLTAHKTVTMFMTYVHTEDDPVRAAAEKVANSGGIPSTAVRWLRRSWRPPPLRMVTRPLPAGNYRPYRHRKHQARAVPPRTKRAKAKPTPEALETAIP